MNRPEYESRLWLLVLQAEEVHKAAYKAVMILKIK